MESMKMWQEDKQINTRTSCGKAITNIQSKRKEENISLQLVNSN